MEISILSYNELIKKILSLKSSVDRNVSDKFSLMDFPLFDPERLQLFDSELIQQGDNFLDKLGGFSIPVNDSIFGEIKLKLDNNWEFYTVYLLHLYIFCSCCNPILDQYGLEIARLFAISVKSDNTMNHILPLVITSQFFLVQLMVKLECESFWMNLGTIIANDFFIKSLITFLVDGLIILEVRRAIFPLPALILFNCSVICSSTSA